MRQGYSSDTFLKDTTLICYNKDTYNIISINNENQLYPIQNDTSVRWVNTYGSTYNEHLKAIIAKNNLDDFLVKLLLDDYTNKVIELEKILFVSIEILKLQNNFFSTKKMAFILNTNFIWSIQEEVGDYFEWIRERIQNKKGIIRDKKADYLFFLILESIIDNYEQTLQAISKSNDQLISHSNIKPTPEFTSTVEARKQEMFKFRKASRALRDAITKLEKVQLDGFNKKYFNNLKDQINNLMGDIDFELQEIESTINMIFSTQGHHLNEVMKTLTIFSIIFTPLTFIAGVYGMNFVNMPELRTQFGYFITLAIMFLISVTIVIYFKRKKWF